MVSLLHPWRDLKSEVAQQEHQDEKSDLVYICLFMQDPFPVTGIRMAPM